MTADDDPFAGRSILDLEAERARLEYALEHLDRTAGRDLVSRMHTRLEQVRAEIRRGGLGSVDKVTVERLSTPSGEHDVPPHGSVGVAVAWDRHQGGRSVYSHMMPNDRDKARRAMGDFMLGGAEESALGHPGAPLRGLRPECAPGRM
jgi:hypothetical protein